MAPKRRLQHALAGTLALALVHVLEHTAQADVLVEGGPEALKIEVRDASVHDTLAVLSAKFGFAVHGSAALDRRVSGTYRGSLQQVVGQFLTGRTYVTRFSQGLSEIRIIDGSGGRTPPAIAPPPRASEPAKSSAPQVPAASPPAAKSFADKAGRVFAPR